MKVWVNKYRYYILGSAVLLLIIYYFSLPKLLFRNPYSTVLEDHQGKLLGAIIAEDGQWRFPQGKDVPEKFKDAIIAFEDKRFYSHPGIDVLALIRATQQNIKSGRAVSHHFRYFERHYFKPKKRNHFDGQVYIITGGNSFSATTLFASSLIKQDNVTVVGEETGGGAYGNSAWLIPDVTLPETKVRFRLPLFRLVIDKNYPKNGKGVQPEVESKPTIEAIKRGIDFKLEKAMELIKKDKESKRPPGLIQ